MTLRYFSSTAGQMVLQSSIISTATSITVDTVSGLPGSTPFTVVLDPGTSLEEICDVTAVAGTTLTITRGVDGSPAQAHSSGAFIRHMAIGRDFREANAHINANSAVHGVTGALVGATDSQSLTNKNLTDVTNTFPGSLVTLTGPQTLTNKTAQSATSGTVGLVVKGVASQSADYFEVQDSTGLVLFKVANDLGGTIQTDGTLSLAATGMANLIGWVARFTAPSVGVVSGIFKRFSSGSTADILQIQDQAGTVLSKFDSGGKLTTPQVTSTGAVSGTTGTFTGIVGAANIQPALSTKVTTSVGSIAGAADVALVTSSATVTGDGVKRYKITASIWCFNSTIASDVFDFKIKDQSTGATIATFREQASPTPSLSVGGGAFVTSDVPAAGAHAYQLTAIRVSGSGTGLVSAAAGSAIEIIVEQIA